MLSMDRSCLTWSSLLSGHDVIGIPLGTRLQSLVLIGGEVHVWIAVKQRSKNYAEWQGTYIRIEQSGRVTRVRHDDAYDTDDEFLIKEASS